MKGLLSLDLVGHRPLDESIGLFGVLRLGGDQVGETFQSGWIACEVFEGIRL